MSLFGSIWFRIAVSASFLGWLVTRIDVAEAAGAVVGMDRVHLAAALGLVAVDRALMACRWVMLVRRSEPAVSVGSAVRVFLLGSYVGYLLPSGLGGDAARAYILARRTEQGVDAVAVVVLDRFLGVCSLALLVAVGLFVRGHETGGGLQRLSAVVAVVAVIGVGGMLWGDRIAGAVLPGAWMRPVGIAGLLRLVNVIGRYRNHYVLILVLLALSLVVQMARVLQAYVLGRGLDIEVGFGYYLSFMPIGIVVMLLPVSVGGFGLAQGVIVWMLRPVGVPDSQSFALSTVFLLAGLVGALPGAFVRLRSRMKAEDPR